MARAVDRLLLRVKDLLLAVRRVTAARGAGRPPERPQIVPRHDGELLADMLANIALRDLTLVESLLAELEQEEHKEQDPSRLEFLFRIDHLATRLRRSSENLLVLAGHEAPSSPEGPVRLLDVVRAAVSESADYGRVHVGALPARSLVPHASDDIAHLIAELLDNALAMSPAHTKVTVSGSASNDTVLVTVEDDGIGIPVDRLAVYNMRLAASTELEPDAARQMGLYVVANLARRHGVYVQIQVRPGGGTTVVLALPQRILIDVEAPAEPVPARAVTGSSSGSAAPAVSPGRAGSAVLASARPGATSVISDMIPDVDPVGHATVPVKRREPTPDPAPHPAPDPAPVTAGGLPRRVRTSGAPRPAEPAEPVELVPPSDATSLFDDLAALDEGRHAAREDAASWEGPWQN